MCSRFVFLNATKVTRLTEPCAEVHQPVLRNLLQRHCALLVGRNGLNFPICTAQWWAFSLALRMHSRRLWRDCSGLLYGGNGLHVRKTVPAIRSSLTSCRDPVIGAQYRWSANFAPFAPRFWGLIQGTNDALIAWPACSYASRMADCQCLDHQLRRTSRHHCRKYRRPRSIPLPGLSAKELAYHLDDVGTDHGPFPIQSVVQAASQRV